MIIRVIKVNYTLVKDDSTWIANIGAKNVDQAVKYLAKTVGEIRIESTEDRGSLNALTPQVEKFIVDVAKKTKENAKKAKEKLDTTQKENEALKDQLAKLEGDMKKLLNEKKASTKPKEDKKFKKKIKLGDK